MDDKPDDTQEHAEPAEEQDARPERDPLWDCVPYVVPYAIFAILTYAADYLVEWRSVIYAVKVFAVIAALVYYRKVYTEIRVSFSRDTLVAAGVGVLIIVLWVGLDPYYPQSTEEWSTIEYGYRGSFEHADKIEGAFDPYAEGQIMPPIAAIIFRIIGAVLIVPVFEELFVRSWLIRFIVKERFQQVPVGLFTFPSFLVTVALFGLTHHEWLAGLICGLAWNGLLYWRKDLFLCIVSHAVANLALAAWVVSQGAWQFW